MKVTTFFLIFTLSQQIYALQIHDVSVSAISENAINVSVNTEAIEWYYFNSWQYSISGNTITLHAFYVEGFGSAISLLNNNFEVPLSTLQSSAWHLIVQAYYTDLKTNENQLQDTVEGNFKLPLTGTEILNDDVYSTNDTFIFPNPCHGELQINEVDGNVDIYTVSGLLAKSVTPRKEIIYLHDLQDGWYCVRFYRQKRLKAIKVILKKE